MLYSSVGSPFDSRAHALLYVARHLPDRRAPQAEVALQGYRRAYQQITLPEVRAKLLPPTELSIVAVGNGWRVLDNETAQTTRAMHEQCSAGRRSSKLAASIAGR